MLLDPVALAWTSWLGLAVGGLGTLISCVGLILTFREARRAREAAGAARAEVARVIALIRSRTRLASFSSAVSQADLVMSRMERDALQSSPELLTSFRRLVKEALGTMARDGAPEVRSAMTRIDRQLDLIAKLVSSSGDLKLRQAQMMRAFEDVRT